VANIASLGSGIAMGSMEILKQLESEALIVGSVNASPLLTSREDYPMYLRLRNSI